MRKDKEKTKKPAMAGQTSYLGAIVAISYALNIFYKKRQQGRTGKKNQTCNWETWDMNKQSWLLPKNKIQMYFSSKIWGNARKNKEEQGKDKKVSTYLRLPLIKLSLSSLFCLCFSVWEKEKRKRRRETQREKKKEEDLKLQ